MTATVTSATVATVPSGLYGGVYVSYTAIAGEAIKAGDLLIADKSGNPANTVGVAAASGVWHGKWPVGVALDDQASGYPVTVITSGIVNMKNDNDTTVIKAGAPLKGGAYKGTVAPATPTAATGQLTDTLIGVALDSIAGTTSGSGYPYGFGRVLLHVH